MIHLGAVLVMVRAGVALAKFVECGGGRCEGTNRADTLRKKGTPATLRREKQ